VPDIHTSAEIDVRAPASLAFGVIADDLLRVVDEPDAITGHRPADSGPLRNGFRWRQWIVHDRRRCLSDWVVTSVHEPLHLEQAMWHYCAVAKAQVLGGERWELAERSDGSTVVTLRSWIAREGLAGWRHKLIAWTRPVDERNVSLRKRLAYVQFEAERRTSA
jgi:hypothetical protein